jgi:hypothetical protein
MGHRLEPNIQWVIDPNANNDAEETENLEESIELDTNQDSVAPPTNS